MPLLIEMLFQKSIQPIVPSHYCANKQRFVIWYQIKHYQDNKTIFIRVVLTEKEGFGADIILAFLT